ncbi:rod shape-determining protein MreD [Paracoccus jiaweipingae]|uniref:rod shape-determining protein MreD n=1 Tax=unclassified Paracoccus (in: a-proteobacteria) TaxID=2688777 RepID=UPI0037ACE716
MNTPGTRRRIVGMAIYALLALAIIVLRLMPLSQGSLRFPGPDLLLCLSLVWVLRRPRDVPAPLIAGLVLIEDIVTLRAPGLWALAVLTGTEAARRREHRWRDQPFLVEWLRVAVLMGAMMIGTRLVLMLVLVPVPPLGQVVLQFLATAGAYPVVALLARWGLGLRRGAATDQDMQG